GLVQSLYRLGSGTALALTTARYYTPSGRLIQRDYSKSFYDYYYTDIGVDADPEFREKAFTETGREVYGGGGLTTDVHVDIPQASKFVDLLNSEYIFFNFAKHYTSADERKLQAQDGNSGEVKLQVIDRRFEVTDKTMEDFKAFLQRSKIQFTDQDIADNLTQIKQQIKQEVFNTVWGTEEGYKITETNDPQMLKGLDEIPKAEALLKTRKEKAVASLNQK